MPLPRGLPPPPEPEPVEDDHGITIKISLGAREAAVALEQSGAAARRMQFIRSTVPMLNLNGGAPRKRAGRSTAAHLTPKPAASAAAEQAPAPSASATGMHPPANTSSPMSSAALHSAQQNAAAALAADEMQVNSGNQPPSRPAFCTKAVGSVAASAAKAREGLDFLSRLESVEKKETADLKRLRELERAHELAMQPPKAQPRSLVAMQLKPQTQTMAAPPPRGRSPKEQARGQSSNLLRSQRQAAREHAREKREHQLEAEQRKQRDERRERREALREQLREQQLYLGQHSEQLAQLGAALFGQGQQLTRQGEFTVPASASQLERRDTGQTGFSTQRRALGRSASSGRSVFGSAFGVSAAATRRTRTGGEFLKSSESSVLKGAMGVRTLRQYWEQRITRRDNKPSSSPSSRRPNQLPLHSERDEIIEVEASLGKIRAVKDQTSKDTPGRLSRRPSFVPMRQQRSLRGAPAIPGDGGSSTPLRKQSNPLMRSGSAASSKTQTRRSAAGGLYAMQGHGSRSGRERASGRGGVGIGAGNGLAEGVSLGVRCVTQWISESARMLPFATKRPVTTTPPRGLRQSMPTPKGAPFSGHRSGEGWSQSFAQERHSVNV